MPLWASVVIVLGAIGLYAFVAAVIAFSLPDEPTHAQMAGTIFWPFYPLVRVAFALGGLAMRMGLAIRQRREIPRARVRSEGDGTETLRG